MHRTLSALLLAALVAATDCLAQTQGAPDEVLAENALVKLTRADYEAELLMRVPPGMRTEFQMSPQRLTLFLNTLLIDKTLAQEARNAGLDRDPEVVRRLQSETDKMYAQLMLAKIEADAAAEFDKQSERFVAAARETYLLDKAKYVLPEQVSASHILFETSKGGDDAALARAKEARAKLLAGADFATLAKQVSDDKTAPFNGGALGWFGPGKMDPAFSKAAFDLKKVGDLSEPVKSQFGWHIIRLDGRQASRPMTFEEAQKVIMPELKARHVQEARTQKLAAIAKDPEMKVNQPAIDGLVVKAPDIVQPRAPVTH
ncbi:MAG TPA: peptidylprolyl isomerase [Casimicrobiaceae bacterium]